MTHFSHVVVRENRIVDARLRGITVGEMSMGMVEHNEVAGSLGVGILCLDYSQCEIERNVVTSTRPDTASGDLTRRGVAIEAHYFARAQLRSNTVVRSPGGVAAFDGATIARR